MQLFSSTLSVAALAGLLAAAMPANPAPSARAAAETFTVDNVHSTAIFHTKHLGISEAYGRFNRFGEASEIVLDADPAKSSVRIVIVADSVDTNNGDRDKHLRSGDFLAAKEFPEIVFESSKITGDDKAWEVTGALSFHGVTKTVKAKAHQSGKGEAQGKAKLGLVAEFSIDMADFGIEMVKKNPGAVGPTVAFTVSLECDKQ